MNIIEWHFVFHSPSKISEMRSGKASWYSAFGHVEAYGQTIDETWLFFDPRGVGGQLFITHHHQEVEELLAYRYWVASEIIRIAPTQDKIRFPLHMPMNCVTQCAALLGWRAYSPPGFRRKLLRNGAEIIHGPERR